MKTSYLLIACAVVLVAVLVLWFLPKPAPEPLPVPTPLETVSDADVESYVRTNISTLSPEPAVLGGTFYVTRIELNAGSGTVWYEDGHIALVADFTYATSSESVVVTSFTIREN